MERMDFNAKNFSYVSTRFGDFMESVKRGKRVYLRALSARDPTSLPARLEDDFPAISGDFELPACLDTAKANVFSSVLRISGPVIMWLHYDVS